MKVQIFRLFAYLFVIFCLWSLVSVEMFANQDRDEVQWNATPETQKITKKTKKLKREAATMTQPPFASWQKKIRGNQTD